MTGAIPPYGKHFRRERTEYDMTRRFASRRYVLKKDEDYDVIADPTSERWFIRFKLTILNGRKPFDRFQDAMAALVEAHKILHP